MKKYITLFIAVLFFAACSSGGNSSAKDAARESIQSVTQNPTPVPNATLPVGTAGSVLHYTCPNNCVGSGGPAQANCPVCGTAYAHNQAFHNQPAAATGNPAAVNAATPSPAQNAAGVYHYSCADGCAGGAAAAGNCATCGKALAHNAAYHN